ncbi:hypothetical protein PAGU2638_04480 [Lysobacter sp. PAGU 2638]
MSGWSAETADTATVSNAAAATARNVFIMAMNLIPQQASPFLEGRWHYSPRRRDRCNAAGAVEWRPVLRL